MGYLAITIMRNRVFKYAETMIHDLIIELNQICERHLCQEEDMRACQRINIILMAIRRKGYVILSPTKEPRFDIMKNLKERGKSRFYSNTGTLILNPVVFERVEKSERHWVNGYYILEFRKVWFSYNKTFQREYFKLFNPESKAIFYFPNGDSTVWEK